MTSMSAATQQRIESAADARTELILVQGADAAAAHVAAWDELSGAASEPNSFCESWFVLSSLRHLPASDVRIALVYGRDVHDRRALLGVFPLAAVRSFRGLPAGGWRIWRHDYSFLGAPLVRAGRESAALAGLLRGLRSHGAARGLLEFGMLTADGAFRRAIDECAQRARRPLLVTDRYERALLHVPAAYDEYFQTTFDRKRRKEFVRQSNRLRDAGTVEARQLGPHDDAEAWVDAFLELEAAGWKGRDGTALAARDADRRFLRESALEAHRRGRLMLLALRVDGKPIAMKLNWLAESGGFAFKIAYDEAWAAYSPGLHLELANVEQLAASGRTRWMDSCADADHFMANRIWPGRRPIETVLLPLGMGGAFVIRMLRLAQAARRFRKAPAGSASVAPAKDGVDS